MRAWLVVSPGLAGFFFFLSLSHYIYKTLPFEATKRQPFTYTLHLSLLVFVSTTSTPTLHPPISLCQTAEVNSGSAIAVMDSDYGIPRELSDLQKLRALYQPTLPPCLQVFTHSKPNSFSALLVLPWFWIFVRIIYYSIVLDSVSCFGWLKFRFSSPCRSDFRNSELLIVA